MDFTDEKLREVARVTKKNFDMITGCVGEVNRCSNQAERVQKFGKHLDLVAKLVGGAPFATVATLVGASINIERLGLAAEAANLLGYSAAIAMVTNGLADSKPLECQVNVGELYMAQLLGDGWNVLQLPEAEQVALADAMTELCGLTPDVTFLGRLLHLCLTPQTLHLGDHSLCGSRAACNMKAALIRVGIHIGIVASLRVAEMRGGGA